LQHLYSSYKHIGSFTHRNAVVLLQVI